MSQLNLRKLLIVPTCIFSISAFLFLNPAIAQQTRTCSIIYNQDELRLNSASQKVASQVSMSSERIYTDWSDLDNGQLMDNRSINMTINPGEISKGLIFSDFGFNIPSTSHVTGIEVLLTGSGDSIAGVWDHSIRLTKSSGVPHSENKAKNLTKGTPWSVDSTFHTNTWMYGHTTDDWNSAWSASDINNAGFGVVIQYSNSGTETATLHLDQLRIVVHYEPPIRVCSDHACIPVYTLPDNDVESYSWEVSGGLVWEPIENSDFTINVLTDQSSYGTYEICLTKTYTDGHVETCCRALVYEDCTRASLGDYVWADYNGDGLQDSGEPGLPGCRINLYDESLNFIDYDYTDSEGKYLFEDLKPGHYIVQVGLKGMMRTVTNNSSEELNSDYSPMIMMDASGIIWLDPDEHRRDVDFGIVRPGSICGVSWIDTNGDGVIDVTDGVLDSIEVCLYNSANELMSCTTTDSLGNYSFDNIRPGDYNVQFTIDEEFVATSTDQDNNISNQNFSSSVNVPYGGKSVINAGVYRYSTLGDYVWFDENEDGVQDPSESGIEDITVRLLTCDGDVVDEVVTDANGAYQFVDVSPGQYQICAETDRNDIVPTDGVNSDSHTDSNIDLTSDTYCTTCFIVGENTHDDSFDFGFKNGLVKIDVVTFIDDNTDNRVDDNEELVPGATIELYHCDGTLIATAVTNDEGYVWYEDLLPEEYYIKVIPPHGYDIVPNGYVDGTHGEGTTACYDSRPEGFTLEIGLVRQLVDIDVFVFDDVNNNGVIDAGETRMEGVVIEVYKCDGTYVDRAVTDSDGGVWFEELIRMGYYFQMTMPDGYQLVRNNIITGNNGAGTTDCYDEDPPGFTLEIGIERQKVAIDVYVFEDENGDGIIDDNENRIVDVEVNVYSCDGTFIGSQITDIDGGVWFMDLIRMGYYLQIDVPYGYQLTDNSLITGANGPGTTDCYDDNVPRFDVEIGLERQRVDLDLFVFADDNKNGTIDDDERRMDDVTVAVYKCDGTFIDEANTDADGSVWFDQLIRMGYYFQVTIPDGYQLVDNDIITGANGAGTTDCYDEDPPGLTLEVGLERQKVDIDVFIFEDDDLDGVIDNGEDRIEGVEINLYECDGTYVDTQITDGDGGIWFMGMIRMGYYVEVIIPEGYELVDNNIITGANGPGTTDCYDDDVPRFDLEIGLQKKRVDIDVFIFEDDNRNGSIDNDEDRISDVVVEIYSCDGTLVQSLTTDADGAVWFEQLVQSGYYIKIEMPEGYELVNNNIITGANGAGTTDCYDIDDTNFDLEIGLVRQEVGIDVYVYNDENGDGVFDNEEDGIPQVEVEVYLCDGTLVDSDLTDSSGGAWFKDLTRMGYYLKIIVPDGYQLVDDSIITGANGAGTTDCYDDNVPRYDIEIGLERLRMDVYVIVFEDENRDGTIGNGESGFEGLEIEIYRCDGTLVEDELTNADGGVSFDQIVRTGYYIKVQLPSGYQLVDNDIITGANGSGTSDCYDNDVPSFVLQVGLQRQEVGIDVIVYEDDNEDGILSTDESRIQDVNIELYLCDGTLVDDQVTDVTGGIWFRDLPRTGYYLKINVPTGYELTSNNIITEANGPNTTDCINNNVPRIDIEIGLKPVVQQFDISGYVWRDSDGNLIDNDELALEQVSIDLYDCNQQYIMTETSDEGGNFSFADMQEGDYYIGVQPMDDFDVVVGGDSDISDANGENSTDCIRFNVQNSGPITLGMIPMSRIISNTFMDNNRNGIRDAGDTDIEGMMIVMRDMQDSEIQQFESDQNGQALFQNVYPGSYRLEVMPSQSNLIPTYPNNGPEDSDSDITNENGRFLTEVFTLRDLNVIENIDFGFVEVEEEKNALISGTVWRDSNGDRLYEGEETIEGIEIKLHNCDGGIEVARTLTNQQGGFSFTDVVPGNYYLQVEDHRDFYYATGGDSDISNVMAIGATDCITIEEEEVVEQLFGMIPLSDIGDYVWLDSNVNGIQDADEQGIPNVQLELVNENGVPIWVMETDDTGHYLIQDIPAGNYQLVINNLEGYQPTIASAGSGDVDSDLNLVNSAMISDQFTLYDGEDDLSIDLGLVLESFVLGGLAYFDSNGDGIFGGGDTRATGLPVELYTENGDLVDSATTDNDGVYSFYSVVPGSYYVHFEIEDRYSFSVPYQGGNDILDSDVVDQDGNSEIIVGSGGDVIIGINAAIRLKSSQVSGRVWDDANYNGNLDNNENGVGTVTVNLLDTDGDLVLTTRTNSNGDYLFDNVVAGAYSIEVIKPDAYDDYTLYQMGNNQSSSSQVIRSNGQTQIFDVVEGESYNQINAGLFVNNTQIGGIVWNDSNEDGLYTPDELGLESIKVYLHTSDRRRIDSTLTDVLGNFTFEKVSAGEHYLIFDIVEGFRATSYRAGGSATNDSEVIYPVLGATNVFFIRYGEQFSHINAGLIEIEEPIEVELFSVSGSVWEDTNGDGRFDNAESGADGITVNLYDESGSLIQSVLSTDHPDLGTSGYYIFENVEVGSYYVDFRLPNNAVATITGADSDILTTQRTTVFTVQGGSLSNIDAGYFYYASIGDYIWFDNNEDGVQDDNETGVERYLIQLYDEQDRQVFTTFSDRTGKYSFDEVVPGDYYVKINLQQGITFSAGLSTDAENDSNVTGANGVGTTEFFTINSGEVDNSIDLGLVLAPATIGDRLWFDENANGIFENNEEGINGIDVHLYTSTGTLVETVTTYGTGEGDGYYLIENIIPGQYYVRFDLPSNYSTSASDVGGNDATDSDIDNSNGFGSTSIFSLDPGEEDYDIDGGVFSTMKIGSYVWHDRDEDGIRDVLETGVSGVDIILFSESGELLAQTTSNGVGRYSFDDVAAGNYFVQFLLAEDFTFTTKNSGSSEEDSDVNANGSTDVFTVTTGVDRLDIDAGLVRPKNVISGLVWYDNDLDGVYQSSESVVVGNTVWLLTESLTVLDETQTGSGGRYIFENIPDGSYVVQFFKEAGLEFTSINIGSDGLVDSDADANGYSEVLVVDGITVHRGVNAGMITSQSNRASEVFPNPVRGETMTVRTELYRDNLNLTYELYDLNGFLIKSWNKHGGHYQGQQTHHLDVDNVRPGTYLLRTLYGSWVDKRKVIILND